MHQTLQQRIAAAEAGSFGEPPLADWPRPKTIVRLRVFGRAGDRDPDAPCDEFTPGEPNGRCKTDGHYMCRECEHCELCEGCRQIDAHCECCTECDGEGSTGEHWECPDCHEVAGSFAACGNVYDDDCCPSCGGGFVRVLDPCDPCGGTGRSGGGSQ